jgi:hypothetical protein
MKKLIITAILAAILPAYLATAEDQNGNGSSPDGKPKQGQGGKCHGKDGNGKHRKKGQPGENGPQKNQN